MRTIFALSAMILVSCSLLAQSQEKTPVPKQGDKKTNPAAPEEGSPKPQAGKISGHWMHMLLITPAQEKEQEPTAFLLVETIYTVPGKKTKFLYPSMLPLHFKKKGVMDAPWGNETTLVLSDDKVPAFVQKFYIVKQDWNGKVINVKEKVETIDFEAHPLKPVENKAGLVVWVLPFPDSACTQPDRHGLYSKMPWWWLIEKAMTDWEIYWKEGEPFVRPMKLPTGAGLTETDKAWGKLYEEEEGATDKHDSEDKALEKDFKENKKEEKKGSPQEKK